MMQRDLESEIRQAARDLDDAKLRLEVLRMQNTSPPGPERQLQAEEYQLAVRRVYERQWALNTLMAAPGRVDE